MTSDMDQPNQKGKAVDVLIGIDRGMGFNRSGCMVWEIYWRRITTFPLSLGQCHRIHHHHKRPLTTFGRHEAGGFTKLSFIIVLHNHVFVNANAGIFNGALEPSCSCAENLSTGRRRPQSTVNHLFIRCLSFTSDTSPSSAAETGEDKDLRQFPCYLRMGIDICRVFIRCTMEKKPWCYKETARRPHLLSQPWRATLFML